MMRYWLLPALFSLSAVVRGASPPMGVCEAIQKSDELNGKTIAIMAVVRRTDEVAVLIDPSCQKRLLFQYPDELTPRPDFDTTHDSLFKTFSLAFNLMDFGEKPNIELRLYLKDDSNLH